MCPRDNGAAVVEPSAEHRAPDVRRRRIDPYAAAVLPRMQPMRNDFIIEIETRIPERVVGDLARSGGKVEPLPLYDLNMGSYRQAWRDPVTALLSASTDPRPVASDADERFPLFATTGD